MQNDMSRPFFRKQDEKPETRLSSIPQ